MTPTLAEIEARLHCSRCNDTGCETDSYATHDPHCDGTCRNCPVEEQETIPCRSCGDGESQAPMSVAEVRALLSLVRSRDARLAEIAAITRMAGGSAAPPRSDIGRIHALATKEQA